MKCGYLDAVSRQVAVLIKHEAHILLDIEGVKQGSILKDHANFELAGQLFVICQKPFPGPALDQHLALHQPLTMLFFSYKYQACSNEMSHSCASSYCWDP